MGEFYAFFRRVRGDRGAGMYYDCSATLLVASGAGSATRLTDYSQPLLYPLLYICTVEFRPFKKGG